MRHSEKKRGREWAGVSVFLGAGFVPGGSSSSRLKLHWEVGRKREWAREV